MRSSGQHRIAVAGQYSPQRERRYVAGHALPDAEFCGLPRCSSDWEAAKGGMMWHPFMRRELGMAGDGPPRKTLPLNGGAVGASPDAAGIPRSALPSGFRIVSAECAEIVAPILFRPDHQPTGGHLWGAPPGRWSGAERFGKEGDDPAFFAFVGYAIHRATRRDDIGVTRPWLQDGSIR